MWQTLFSRDSMIWWLGFAICIVGYLSVSPSPATWTYEQWIAAVMAILMWLSGKLATSPLAGAPKDGVTKS